MNRMFYIFLLLACGCKPQDAEMLRAENPVLTGILYAGQSSSEIHFFKLAEGETGIQSLQDLNLKMMDNLGNETAFVRSGSSYVNNEAMIASGRTYTLNGTHNNAEITSSCTIPPALILVSISNDIITVDENSEGEPVTHVTWNDLNSDQYVFAMKLENLETNKVEIPFTVPSGNFDRLYASPVVNSAVTLFDTDFRYYGAHRLTVYAVDSAVESIYFYNSSDLRGLLQSAPDNITGAQGYFMGVSMFTVDMLIE